MRTSEERARLIRKRTAELKRGQQRRKQRVWDCVCVAACLLLPTAIAGGAVSVDAPPLAFYALCVADPLAWIAADAVLCYPFFRNILKSDYGYLRQGSA